MVFCVYFDPIVISAAESSGTYALQCLIGILRGFEANCLLAEFDDYFVQEAMKERLNDLQDDNARKCAFQRSRTPVPIQIGRSFQLMSDSCRSEATLCGYS